MVCPDCYKAGISQKIELKRDKCPDCGGEYVQGEWISAPQYPDSTMEYIELMNTQLVSNAYKHNGVWKGRDVRRIG